MRWRIKIVSIFAFVKNSKQESTLKAVEVAKFIAQTTPNDNMLEVTKFIAEKAQMSIITACWKYMKIHLFRTINGI